VNLAERVLTVPEGAEVLRVGVRSLYAAIARGEVPAVRIGRSIRIPGAALARLLAEGEEQDNGDRAVTRASSNGRVVE
jgi:excisionase family DNA binding protein